MKGKALLILTIILTVQLRAQIVNLGLPKNCNLSGNCGATKQFEGFGDFSSFVDKYYSKEQIKKWQYQQVEIPKRDFVYIGNQYEDYASQIKTDGAYIYSISGNNLSIVKAYPAETSELISTITLENQYFIEGLLIYKDVLAIFGSKGWWADDQEVLTSVWMYNVFDKLKPQLKNRFIISGQNYGSYLFQKGSLHLISSSLMNESKILPYYDIGNGKVPFSWSDIHYYPQWADIYNRPEFINIVAFDLNDPQSTFLASSFVCQNRVFYRLKQNIYIFQNDQRDSGRSMISKIIVSKKYIRPIAFTIVSGNIKDNMNPFSQFQGYLRVLTTNRNDNNKTSSSILILSYYLNIYGKLTNIALKERIFYCAFVSKKLYLVTNRQIDPLLAFDLSNPASPVLLGQVKFPSHYTYFQPYPNGQNAVIGFGEKVTEQSKEKVIQATIFNTVDPLNPKQASSYNISYKNMYIQKPLPFQQYYDLLLAPHKNVLVLPIEAGALLFYISPNAIRLKQIIQHIQGKQNNQTNYLKSRVRKSVIIKDTLYTISSCKVIATDLASYKNVQTILLGCPSQIV